MRTLSLSNSEILEVRNALAAISAGYTTTVDGKTTIRPFRFPTGPTLALATLEVAIKPAGKAFDAANKALFRSYEPVPTHVAEDKPEELLIPPGRYLAYQEATEALFAAEVEVSIPALRLIDLNVGESKDGKNPIPAAVLAALAPVLEGGLAPLSSEE